MMERAGLAAAASPSPSKVVTITLWSARAALATMAAGSSGRRPRRHQRSGDLAGIFARHVEHQSRRALRQRRPVQLRQFAVGAMAGDEGDGMVGVAMGDGNAGIGQPPMPAVMPGTMRNGTSARASACASSPPRPKTKGSPPFSRSTRLPFFARSTSRSEMSLCLQLTTPARLPAKISPRLWPGQLQQTFVDQRVVENEIGLRRAHAGPAR